MKKLNTLLLVTLLSLTNLVLKAGPGDTTVVQVMTYGSAQDTTVLFPPASLSAYKVLMLYKLKCNPAQNPACGEWDYLTYTYLYKGTGVNDSTIAGIDTTFDNNQNIISIDTTWNVFEVQERFELARYITPYGINLDLGAGFTWVFDISDYKPLLHDSVRISAGNWQELLDLKILFIEGTPPRQPYQVTNIWNGNPAYGTNTSIETFLNPRTVPIDANSANTRLKMRVTGHGFGGTENCAEFCPKAHSIWVNGTQRYSKVVWRDNCAKNPVYPQGGTWVYNRTNWCPGAEVWTYDVELTPWVTAGQTTNLDYNVEPYTWDGQGSLPYFAIETQLVNYYAPNFTLDAALEDIVSPTNADMYGRANPICARPEVIIKNTGTTALTTAYITYGVVGGTPETYKWTGNLAFLDTAHVVLPTFNWAGIGPNNYNFYATISSPNDGTDEYQYNNTAKSTFTPTPTLAESKFEIRMKTNNIGSQNSWELRNLSGDVIASRDNCSNNTIYKDTVDLAPGCYEFKLLDTGEDGLSWWANNDGAGYIRFYKMSGSILKSFGADFGSEILFNFTVGTVLSTNEHTVGTMLMFPNPSAGEVYMELPNNDSGDKLVVVTDLMGKKVFEKNYSQQNDNLLYMDLSNNPAGMYLVNIFTGKRTYTSKLLIAK